MKSTLLLLAIYFLLSSCKKNAPELLWQCDDNQNLDSAATASKIVGSWRWLQQRSSPGGEIIMADKTIIVTFNSDSTYTVRENAAITTQGNWKLYMFSDNTWALDLTSPSNYLYGAISFCNDKVLFTASVVDGSDNLFEKVD